VISGAVLIAVWGFVLFPLIDTKSGLLITIGMVVGQGIIHPMIYGPLAGLYSELFDTEHRYTGASLGYQIAGIGAGISPVLFAAIMSSNEGTSTVPLSIVLAVFALISVFCVVRLGETKSRSLSERLSTPEPTAATATRKEPQASVRSIRAWPDCPNSRPTTTARRRRSSSTARS